MFLIIQIAVGVLLGFLLIQHYKAIFSALLSLGILALVLGLILAVGIGCYLLYEKYSQFIYILVIPLVLLIAFLIGAIIVDVITKEIIERYPVNLVEIIKEETVKNLQQALTVGLFIGGFGFVLCASSIVDSPEINWYTVTLPISIFIAISIVTAIAILKSHNPGFQTRVTLAAYSFSIIIGAFFVLIPFSTYDGNQFSIYTISNRRDLAIGGEYYHKKQDYKSAFEYFKRAAERGDGYSQFSLGVMYFNGESVPVDYRQAYIWLSKAVLSGQKSAIQGRDDAEKLLTPVALQEAKIEIEKN